MKKKLNTKANFYFGIICGVIFFIALWQILSFFSSSLILPSPIEAIKEFFALLKSASFYKQVFATFLRVLKSFCISILISFVLGFLATFSLFFRGFIKFPLAITTTTPVVALILLASFWFSSSNVPIFASLLITVPVMTRSFINALSLIDKKLISMTRAFNFTLFMRFFHLYLPQSMSAFFSSSKSALSLSYKVTVAGEILVLPRFALGTSLSMARNHLESAKVFALVIAIVLLSLASEGLLTFLLKIFIKIKNAWQCNVFKNVQIDDNKNCDTLQQSDEMAIFIKNLFVRQNDFLLYKDFSLSLEPSKMSSFEKVKNNIIAIVGTSGVGKTTLLHAIANLTLHDGTIFCKNMSRYFSIAFQENRLLPNRTVLQNCIIPLKKFYPKKIAVQKALQLLKKVHLLEKIHALPQNLSLGEVQRCSIVRALLYNRDCILLDEPFSSQDVMHKKILQELILNASKKSLVLMVHHSIEESCALCNTVVVLKRNKEKSVFAKTVMRSNFLNENDFALHVKNLLQLD